MNDLSKYDKIIFFLNKLKTQNFGSEKPATYSVKIIDEIKLLLEKYSMSEYVKNVDVIKKEELEFIVDLLIQKLENKKKTKI